MGDTTFTAIDVPEAERLCDLTGIKQDLERAMGFAKVLQKHYYDLPISDALNVAMLVRYSRAFGTGVRANLTEDELQSILSIDEFAHHERFCAWRSMHIAHSVNSYESHQFVVRYDAERVHTEGVASVGVNTSRVMAMSPNDIHLFIKIAERLIRYVDEQIQTEEQRLLPLVRKIPVNALLQHPRKVRPKQGAAQLGRPRAKLSTRKRGK